LDLAALIKATVDTYERTFIVIAIDHKVVFLVFGMWLGRMRDINVLKVIYILNLLAIVVIGNSTK
jgi:hypothetical protein